MNNLNSNNLEEIVRLVVNQLVSNSSTLNTEPHPQYPDFIPLSKIVVPPPKPDENYHINLLGNDYSFTGLKKLLGAADISKAGDRMANLAAENEVVREAARSILSDLTLEHLYEHPLTDDKGQIDDVMRVNYTINLDSYANIKQMTLGELKDHMMSCKTQALRKIGQGMTGVMVAALTKLLDVHEMIYLAKKLKVGASGKARTMLGLPGTLSTRLQPNHPTDNLNGVTLLLYTGLSMGAGDALLGLNPAIDTVDNISMILHHIDKIRRETGAPTQICVLSHIKTQLQCLEAGAPVEIMFQSLAGTDKTLTGEFDVTIDLLDQAYITMKEKGPLAGTSENWMYFETGQGSEVSYDKHNGIDMTTTEALCYGLARRYRPFMVNNVTGFIGPETHYDNFEMIYANLQDHFMGKLLGLPMGMAPCFTLHAKVTTEGQQMATELLTAAGCNYYMDVYLNTDRMLAYFDTSSHDDQTMREIHGLKPAPEFLRWAISKGIFIEDQWGNVERGPNWGNPKIFCKSEGDFEYLRKSVSAAYGFDNAGPRPANKVARTVKINQAIAREAIYAKLDPNLMEDLKLRHLTTKSPDKETHLSHPDLGAFLSEESLKTITPENKDIQIVISDGLSAEAIHHNIPEILPVLIDGFKTHNVTIGEPIIAPLGRVKLSESVAKALNAKVIVMLIGERPGGDALASRSMSAYLTYYITDPDTKQKATKFSGNASIEFENTVISNIYSGGLSPLEAGAVIVERAMEILKHKAAGNRLESVRR